MRGQKMNEAQAREVTRLLAKGWRGRESDMFALAVPMYRDRPCRFGRWPNSPDPCVIHVRRDGRCYRGYPGHSSSESTAGHGRKNHADTDSPYRPLGQPDRPAS